MHVLQQPNLMYSCRSMMHFLWWGPFPFPLKKPLVITANLKSWQQTWSTSTRQQESQENQETLSTAIWMSLIRFVLAWLSHFSFAWWEIMLMCVILCIVCNRETVNPLSVKNNLWCILSICMQLDLKLLTAVLHLMVHPDIQSLNFKIVHCIVF